jgi:hypothetical protein
MNLQIDDANESNLNQFWTGFGLDYISKLLVFIDIKSSKTAPMIKKIQMKKKRK